jgi:hypothetical protein
MISLERWNDWNFYFIDTIDVIMEIIDSSLESRLSRWNIHGEDKQPAQAHRDHHYSAPTCGRNPFRADKVHWLAAV